MMTGTDLYTTGAYAEAYPSWHAEDAAWKAQHIVKILRRNRIEPRSIVDVGCGAGGVLSGVVKEFPDSMGTGFDISPQAISMAKADSPPRQSFVCGDFLQTERTDYDLL